MKLPLITIGIPTYNRASGTMMATVQSALNQTYARVEVIVSDNCSTDDTPRLLAAVDNPRLRYIRHAKNLGPNGNFNACLDAAAGEYFLLLHDDDLIDPDFVEVCVNALPADRPVGVIRTGIRIIDGEGNTIATLPNLSRATTLRDFIVDWFDRKTSPYCANTLINTAVLRTAGGFHSRHDLFVDVLAHVKVMASHGCVNVPDVKASFRRHGPSMGSAALIRHWCEDSRELLDTISELVPDPNIRALGEPFFCRINYGYAADLDSPLRRLLSYLEVARLFNYSDPPLRYVYRKEIRPALRRLKSRVTGNGRSSRERWSSYDPPD